MGLRPLKKIKTGLKMPQTQTKNAWRIVLRLGKKKRPKQKGRPNHRENPSQGETMKKKQGRKVA